MEKGLLHGLFLRCRWAGNFDDTDICCTHWKYSYCIEQLNKCISEGTQNELLDCMYAG